MDIQNLFEQHDLTEDQSVRISQFSDKVYEIAVLISEGNKQAAKDLLPTVRNLIESDTPSGLLQSQAYLQYNQVSFWLSGMYGTSPMGLDSNIPILALLNLRMWFTASIAVDEVVDIDDQEIFE